MSFPRWDELWRHWDKREIWLWKKNYFLHKFSPLHTLWKLNREAQHSRTRQICKFSWKFFIVHRDSFTLHFNSRKFFEAKNECSTIRAGSRRIPKTLTDCCPKNMKYFMQLIQHSSLLVWQGTDKFHSWKHITHTMISCRKRKKEHIEADKFSININESENPLYLVISTFDDCTMYNMFKRKFIHFLRPLRSVSSARICHNQVSSRAETQRKTF